MHKQEKFWAMDKGYEFGAYWMDGDFYPSHDGIFLCRYKTCKSLRFLKFERAYSATYSDIRKQWSNEDGITIDANAIEWTKGLRP